LFWIGTSSGLLVYNNELKQHDENSNWITSVLDGLDVRFINEKNKSEIWIGTYESGLYVCFPDEKRIEHYRPELQEGSLSKNLLTYCHFDVNGNAWLGTFNNAVEVSLNLSRQFNDNPELNRITRGKFITSIIETHGSYFFGTRESGLIEFNKKNQTHKTYTVDNSNLASNFIVSLFKDSKGEILVGLNGKLQKLNLQTSVFQSLNVPENCGEILSFAEAENGNLYFGTDALGLIEYQYSENSYKVINELGTNVRQVYFLNKTELMVCSISQGIFIYNIASKEIRKLGSDIALEPWKDARFLSFHVDSDSILWVGNFKWGLIRYDLQTNDVKVFDRTDGLPSNDVVGFFEDINGFLWLSTSYGLSRFNKVNSFINFSIEDGIENQQFHQNSVCFDQEKVFFGGNFGLTYFNPGQFAKLNDSPVSMVFKSLYVNYKKIEPGDENKILNQSLSVSSSVTLSNKQRSFSIDYVAFDYSGSNNVDYSYMLEGFDEGWINVGKTKRAVYSNLFPGKYTFKVKARNSESGYSEPIVLQIRVKQTPWLSFWAILFYILVLTAIVIVIFRLSLQAKLFKKEKELEHSERLRESEVHGMKLKFFANISHEFRTPLSVISGVLFLMSKNIEFTGYAKDLYVSLNQNVERLLRLINQLLTFRELESDTLSLMLRKGNIAEHIEQICNAFLYYAQLKEIELIKEYTDADYQFYYDSDKFEKILSNLLSNAFKYTPDGGKVFILLTKITEQEALTKYKNLNNQSFQVSKDGYFEISVADTGEGIKNKFIETIFDRYKRIKPEDKKDYSGSGIGLHFVKRLINIHKGEITLKSTFGQGSVFSFILPADKDIFSAENFIETIEGISEHSYSPVEMKFPAEMAVDDVLHPIRNYKIAVIEDNIELCNLVVSTLSGFYKVIHAYDGKKGFELINTENPDLIISDIMMPEMDGLTLCQKIKSDDRLNHITVILLSAKSEAADQIEGIRKGADIYIPKPFNLEYLMAVVERQYANREKLRNNYLNGTVPNLQETDINQESILFLSKINLILEEEITNTQLGVETLASKMNMGRSNFYKKFETITNISPNAYIVKYRINKAVELLKTQKYSLAEISDMIGFSNSSYFSTTFKKEKGISPREFLKKTI